MGKISYTNKVALNENPEVADINKVKAADLNEIKTVVNANDDLRGDLSTLTTTSKTSVVSAINELNSNKATKTDLGTIANLTTTTKTSAVAAINELDGDIGNLTSLETTNKSSLVNAVNELSAFKAPFDIVTVSSTQPSNNRWKLWVDPSANVDNLYYNNNGANLVKMSAYDTLPVGTEVDYIGDTVPDGWTQVSDYSTTEIDTGKLWIDGKPIYRKCYQKTKSSAGELLIDNISSLDVIIHFQTYLKRTDNYKSINNFYSGSSDMATSYVSTSNNINYVSPYTGTLYVVIEYTKTS